MIYTFGDEFPLKEKQNNFMPPIGRLQRKNSFLCTKLCPQLIRQVIHRLIFFSEFIEQSVLIVLRKSFIGNVNIQRNDL